MNDPTKEQWQRFGSPTTYKWAYGRFAELLRLGWRWPLMYLLAVTLSLLGDLAFCTIGPLPAFWAQVLPQLDLIGIAFAAAAFGPGIGLAAAVVAGASHTAIMATACRHFSSPSVLLLMFAAVGLVTGWTSKHRIAVSVESKRSTPGTDNDSQDCRLTELGRMMPGLVHQFRTPLASIEGAGFVLEDADLSDDKRHEFVGIILKECQRIALLVDLVDFTQPRSWDYREINVSNILDEVVEQCALQKNPAIGLRNLARRNLPRVLCNYQLIKHALLTLTTSALRVMPKGGTVELSGHCEAGETIIRIDACSEHSCPPVDAAFGSNELSEMDLAVVQQIVQQHGGSILVQPHSGRGVTISMILPVNSR